MRIYCKRWPSPNSSTGTALYGRGQLGSIWVKTWRHLPFTSLVVLSMGRLFFHVKLNLIDPCRTIRDSTTVEGCQAGGLGLQFLYMSMYNAESPKQDRKRFNSSVKTINFSVIYLWVKVTLLVHSGVLTLHTEYWFNLIFFSFSNAVYKQTFSQKIRHNSRNSQLCICSPALQYLKLYVNKTQLNNLAFLFVKLLVYFHICWVQTGCILKKILGRHFKNVKLLYKVRIFMFMLYG